VVTAVVILLAALAPRVAQPQSYHQFADRRIWFGIPNFGDVASNLPFAVVGVCGIWFVSSERGRRKFLDKRERWPYALGFFGLFLTAFGSSYYHLAPDNARLVWDRLPMILVFMPLVAAMIAERISVIAGLWLLPVLTAIGAGSVWHWYASELRKEGDLRMYAAVQVYALVMLLVALLLPSRYTRGAELLVGCGILCAGKDSGDMGRPGVRSDRPHRERSHAEASGGGDGGLLGPTDAAKQEAHCFVTPHSRLTFSGKVTLA
jgi:hypothetical protein